MQMPPTETIPTLPDETETGPVPPMGPGKAEPDREDLPISNDLPGENPDFPPAQRPFPDADVQTPPL